MVLAQQPTTAYDLLILAAGGGFLIATLIFVPMLRMQRGARVAPRKQPGLHRKRTDVAAMHALSHGTDPGIHLDPDNEDKSSAEENSGPVPRESGKHWAKPRTVDHGDLFTDRYIGRFDKMRTRIVRINAELEAEPRNL